MPRTSFKNKKKVSKTTPILGAIFNELRLIRQAMLLLAPQENLGGYEHPERIRRSYKKALKHYPVK